MSSVAKSVVLLGLGIAGLFILARRQQVPVQKDHAAFIEYFELLPPPPPAPPKAPPPLTGFTFAVKDIFDVEGHVTGFGNPDWAQSHEAASRTATAVHILVQAGAKCVGKTHMDEMAYSLNGENKHYGTPVNPAAPNRIPGGSSSGSAVAVAADVVDFALGTDTGGSVRAPASYCGILGFRPSHGVISTAGVVPMAQSFDTVGWFAKDPTLLRQVGHIFAAVALHGCEKATPCPNSRGLLQVLSTSRGKSCWPCDSVHSEASWAPRITECLPWRVFGKNCSALRTFRDSLKISGSSFGVLREAMRLLQMFEFKGNHEEWIRATQPDFGTDIGGRVKAALETEPDLIPLVRKMKDECREAMNDLLKNETVLVLPTVPGVAPDLKAKDADDYRAKAFTLLCIGGMSGCCQVNLPVGDIDGAPVGVSLMAKHGADRFLLDTSLALFSTVQEEAKVNSNAKNLSPVAGGKNDAAESAKEKGNAAFKKLDYPKAVSHYSEAIKLDSRNATYYSNRAAAYLQMCSFPQAEADCTKAISLDKKNVKAMLRRGTAREFLGYYKDADEDFRQALVLEPTNKQAMEAVKRLKKLLFD